MQIEASCPFCRCSHDNGAKSTSTHRTPGLSGRPTGGFLHRPAFLEGGKEQRRSLLSAQDRPHWVLWMHSAPTSACPSPSPPASQFAAGPGRLPRPCNRNVLWLPSHTGGTRSCWDGMLIREPHSQLESLDAQIMLFHHTVYKELNSGSFYNSPEVFTRQKP